ncbi:MAG: FAD-dependent oxidoreductase [Fimbriimonadaceae bacterium]|nr:FAD-dependent oxidoreductase [Fimbriimonadaceae bacterium]
MDTIHEPAREVPVVHDADLVVVGGSCTGVFAAVAAARLGLSVALVESLAYFGGVATAGLVCIWHRDSDTAGRLPIWAGLSAEVIDRLRPRHGVLVHEPNDHRHYVLQAAELAVELDRLVVEAGVRPFLHTRFVSPVVADGRVSAVVIEDKTGRRAIRGRYFVDASGDADLVHRAGFATWRAPQVQPPTACALIQGLRHLAGRGLASIVFDERHPEALRRGFLWSAQVPGEDVTMVAGTRVHGADCADAEQLTAAEIEGRRQIRDLLTMVRREVGDPSKVALLGIPAQIGIRQTRQVVCRHRLQASELLAGTRFDDAIANGCYPVDIHHADGDGITFRYLDGREREVSATGTAREGRWRAAGSDCATFYQVPYRSLVPLNARNVLVAGRCLDADQGAFGAARVMVNTNQMGQAAGTACALAARCDGEVGEVDPAALRRALADQGQVIL